MGSVQLIHGDMFSQPCDLMVLPASTSGTATRKVALRLRDLDIPWPSPAPLGSLHVARFDGGQSFAQQVAWATSVQGLGTDLDAIEEIGRKIGNATTIAPFPQNVSAPLLGAGAGHLAPALALDRLTSGFLATSAREATLRIFVLGAETHASLVRHRDELPASAQPSQPVREPLPDARDRDAERVHTSGEPPRVFISYTADQPSVKDWVRELGKYLRASGINARLDLWHLMVGMNLQQWMQNEITQADRVILVCTEAYAARADALDGGLAYEIQQIQQDIGATNPRLKYLPLVWSADTSKALPTFMKPYLFIHWPPDGDDSAARRQLLEAILDRQEEAPPIGAFI